MDLEINREKFIERLKDVSRPGIDALIAYLDETDFFKAPASTRYHSSFDGGLVAHSLMTHKCLIRQAKVMDIPDETLVICGLLHDLCKANFYQKVTKNRKVGMKDNGYGRLVADWEEYETYEVDDHLPLGHGEKSVMIIQNYIKLTDVEMAMIRWHMGPGRDPDEWHGFYNACTVFPQIALMHAADMEATYVYEAGKAVQ